MQINLTGHHVEITSPMRDYVQSKFERIERHFDRVANIHVVLSVEKLRQRAEAELHLYGAQLFANHTEEDMYAAIDGLVDKLDRQLLRYKEKHQNHRGNGVDKYQQPSEPEPEGQA